MSDRNTGLFLSGHVPKEAVVQALLSTPGVDPAELTGDEAPRVGHGARGGRLYTHVGLRLFEVGGLLLIDAVGAPGPDELEMRLGAALSAGGGEAVYLLYDDEGGVGGHARFSGGRLVSRSVIDGRANRPVVRDLEGERPLQDVDPSDWVWAPIAAAVEAGATPIFGAGVRTDDDIEALIQGAAAQPVSLSASAAPQAPRRAEPSAPSSSAPSAGPASGPSASKAAEAPRGGGLLGRLARKVAGKVRGG